MLSIRVTGVLVATLLAGCAPLMGPRSIESSRPAYNQAIQQTNDQELLLNLVRSRYRDTLYFTNVERVAATLEFNQSLGATGLQTRTGHDLVNRSAAAASSISEILTRTFTLGPGSVALNEKPTVFYAPVEGEKFVRQLMTPMNPDLLLMLVKSGWSLDRVFSVGVQELNGLKNAPTASGPGPSREPEFREFREAARLLRSLQREQLIDLAKASSGDGIEVRFAREAAEREETKRLKSLLRLNPARENYRIVIGVAAPNADTIALTTRPLISALNYLSQGIDVPDADLKAGKVRKTVRANGEPFDWQELFKDVFHVAVSATPPEDASVSVHYRNSYFYISDNDLDSKSTFVLLTQLIALHAAPASANLPMAFSFGK